MDCVVCGGLLTHAEQLLASVGDELAPASDENCPRPQSTAPSGNNGQVGFAKTEPPRSRPAEAAPLDHRPRLVTKKEIAQELGFSVRHMDNLLQQGCPHLKFSARSVKFDLAEVLAWSKDKFGIRRRGRLNPA